MLRSLLKILFAPAITALARWWFTRPSREKVHAALDALYLEMETGKKETTKKIAIDMNACRIVIVSDQHKGTRNNADDFRNTADNYCRALHFYDERHFTLINNGDAEELWENTPTEVIEMNKEPLSLEARFVQKNNYYRIFGNHDLEWKLPHQRIHFLEPAMGQPLNVYEGVFLQTNYRSILWTFFITHGHQGDHTSDDNRFSAWFVARIWTPIQRFLGIRLDTTASSFELTDRHNIIMYEWTRSRTHVLLITGHTHKPVFASMDHIDRLNQKLKVARAHNDLPRINELEAEIKRREKEYEGKGRAREKNTPSYFNAGCCCYADGDMTCIEWEGGMIRLVKWQQKEDRSIRQILEEISVSVLLDELIDA